jgi:hypothetical protein
MKHLFAILALLCCLHSVAQISYSAEKEKLYKRLTARTVGPNYSRYIDYFYNNVCDSLVNAKLVIDGDPIENILIRLFGSTSMELDKKTISILRVPSLNASFLDVLKAHQKTTIAPLFRQVGLNRTKILANAFYGLPIGDSIKTFSSLREMVAQPYLIPKRIEDPQYKPYLDTILYYFASEDPELFLTTLETSQFLQTLAAANSNKTINAVEKMKGMGNLNKLLPFGIAIEEGRITPEGVMTLASKPANYHIAFTEEMIRLHTNEDPALRGYLTGYMNAMNAEQAKIFIDPINQLHESADKERYYVLNALPAQDLYMIMVGGASVFYTSSFMYTFNKFMKEVEKEGLENFFERIGYFEFGDFVSLASGYGMINKLMKQMDEEKFANMLANYMRRHIRADRVDRDLISDGMTLSEILFSIRASKKARNIMVQKIDEIAITQQKTDVLIQRMYGGFKDILQDSIQGRLKEIESMYEVLEVDRLKFRDTIVQVGLFYDDVDGLSSFNNYLSFFPAAEWTTEDKGNYIILQSKTGNPMFIYLNKLNTVNGDIAAQNEMLATIDSSGRPITSFLHRGHSYHLAKSLKRIPATAQFVYLGSCGGYNDVVKVFQANPDAHIISTRNIGSKLINDPILSKVNNQAVANQDMNWLELWDSFDKSFKSKNTKELFLAYIPPNKYIGIIFIRDVFNF